MPAGCQADNGTPPQAFVIRGAGDKPYTIVCTRSVSSRDPASPLGAREAYQQALASLHTARVQIKQQTDFPEAERLKALAAIDTSTAELQGDQARARAD